MTIDIRFLIVIRGTTNKEANDIQFMSKYRFRARTIKSVNTKYTRTPAKVLAGNSSVTCSLCLKLGLVDSDFHIEWPVIKSDAFNLP